MSNKLILITGIPGSGKTYLTKYIEKSYSNFKRISFGETLFSNTSKIKYSELRSNPTRNATKFMIEQTIQELEKLINKKIKKNNILLDSHAVVADTYGYRVIPEFNKLLESGIKPSGIIVLNTPKQMIDDFVHRYPEGRKQITDIEYNLFQSLQNSVAITYSVIAGCPLYFIAHSNEKTNIKVNIELLLTDLEIPFS